MADAPRTRLEGLDLARFLAFVGMVIVNFKIAMGAEGETGLLESLTAALQGRAAATFVVLAGVGLGLAAVKGMRQTAGVTLRRAAFLLVIGLLNMLIFEADILHYYAFYFLFGVLLLPLSSRALITAIVALNMGFVAMILTLDYEAGWDWPTYSYDGFWTPVGFVRNLLFNGWHPVFPWLGFLLFGLVLARMDLGARWVQTGLVLGGVSLMACAETLSHWLSTQLAPIDPELPQLVSTQPIPPMPLYTLAGIGAACLTIGLCLMLAPWLKTVGLLQRVAPAGRQTLTLYIAHILLGMGALEVLGMLGNQTLATSVSASLLFCFIATVYAALWSKRFRRGPIEALMRHTAG